MAINENIPILIPIDIDEFWQRIQLIVREEINAKMGRAPLQLKKLAKETTAFQIKPL